MAGVSPKVINALASDKIDLACVQAFTLTGDHKRQERILKRYRTAHQVRKLLTESKLTTGSGLFRFVGTEAYQAEAGTINGEIGGAHDCTPVTNAQLECRLLLEKKHTQANTVPLILHHLLYTHNTRLITHVINDHT